MFVTFVDPVRYTGRGEHQLGELRGPMTFSSSREFSSSHRPSFFQRNDPHKKRLDAALVAHPRAVFSVKRWMNVPRYLRCSSAGIRGSQSTDAHHCSSSVHVCQAAVCDRTIASFVLNRYRFPLMVTCRATLATMLNRNEVAGAAGSCPCHLGRGALLTIPSE